MHHLSVYTSEDIYYYFFFEHHWVGYLHFLAAIACRNFQLALGYRTIFCLPGLLHLHIAGAERFIDAISLVFGVC